MIKEEKIKVAGIDIDVRELTVAEIDKLFASFAIDRQATLAERLIDSPIPIEVVTAATGLGAEELNTKFSPSGLNDIWAATARVNDFLSKMIGRYESILGLSEASTESGSGDSSAE
ncbi:MAG: hypothetical protein VR65_10830 [Desulfobulbaceae bacterium BRH_c16a]|nr:MAG: hypothetical protein VR65_10830 [Desulfobulbaceae bacterium BRH_c16a]